MGVGRIGCLIPLLVLSYSTNFVRSRQINIDVYRSELFIQKVSPDVLSWNEEERKSNFHGLVTSIDGPDLPPWIFTWWNKNHVFIYGAVPKHFDANIFELSASFTNLQSYRSKYCKVIISILPRDEYAVHEIRLRVVNINIDKMLTSDARRNELIRIFEEGLWPEAAGKLYVTHLTESAKEGFALPANPNDTLGVIIHLGAVTNFSVQLYRIHNETKPLSKKCPPSFHKRISVEKLFNPKFILDWCFFKLINVSDDCTPTTASENGSDIPCKSSTVVKKYRYGEGVLTLDNEIETLTIKEEIPKSPIFKTLLTLVIVPSIVLCVFITCWLVFIMCLQSSRLRQQKEDERSTLAFTEYDPKETLFHF